MRPIGAWIADKDVGTVVARRQGMDRRHLEESAADAPPKAYVPGWIGVRTEGGKPWSPSYEGAYIPVLYDTSAATALPLKCLAADTPEEAVRTGSRRGAAGLNACLADVCLACVCLPRAPGPPRSRRAAPDSRDAQGHAL